MSLRLVMMGTGSFALPTFLALYESNHDVVGLFTQPDRTGRGHHHHVNPLKEAAQEHDTPIFQPQSVKDESALNDLRSLNADLCVVAAYGQILSEELLQTPRLGAINVHASILPKYRGAAPIQYAIWNGETETGITIFQIEPKLDAGLMLGVERTEIDPKETHGELEQRLQELAPGLTLRVIDQVESGLVEKTKQDPAQVTRAPRIRKQQGAIDWTKTAEEISWHVRAMQPWPNPFTFLHQDDHAPLRLIVLDVEVIGEFPHPDAEPGTLCAIEGERLMVQSGAGAVEILRLRPEGKRDMTAAEFLHGHHLTESSRLQTAQG